MTRNPNLPLRSLEGPVRVAVLGDDPRLRGTLTARLAADAELRVVEFGEAEVALWDAGAEPARRFDRLASLAAGPVPVVAAIAETAQLGPALAAGARGVVLRDQLGDQLGPALAAVRSGLTVIDAALSPGLSPPRATPPDHRDGRKGGELTERERQVVTLLAEGLSNKLIADRLGISDHTAKFHVNGVMGKLGASTRTEAVVEAVRRGLVAL